MDAGPDYYSRLQSYLFSVGSIHLPWVGPNQQVLRQIHHPHIPLQVELFQFQKADRLC